MDSEENNKYNCDDDFTPDTRVDAELTQLRDEYEEALTNQSYHISNSSSNTIPQFNVVPLPPTSQLAEVPTPFSDTPSTQVNEYSTTPALTQPLRQQNDFTRYTPSTTDTAHPDRTTQFIPITQQELERRRLTPSITQPLLQYNTSLRALNKSHAPMNMNVKPNNKPNTRNSKPSNFVLLLIIIIIILKSLSTP